MYIARWVPKEEEDEYEEEQDKEITPYQEELYNEIEEDLREFYGCVDVIIDVTNRRFPFDRKRVVFRDIFNKPRILGRGVMRQLMVKSPNVPLPPVVNKIDIQTTAEVKNYTAGMAMFSDWIKTQFIAKERNGESLRQYGAREIVSSNALNFAQVDSIMHMLGAVRRYDYLKIRVGNSKDEPIYISDAPEMHDRTIRGANKLSISTVPDNKRALADQQDSNILLIKGVDPNTDKQIFDWHTFEWLRNHSWQIVGNQRMRISWVRVDTDDVKKIVAALGIETEIYTDADWDNDDDN
jgi:hypothetical protein